MNTWSEILAAPCLVINMEKCTRRAASALSRVRAAGFENVTRLSAVDASTPELDECWRRYGCKPNPIDPEFTVFTGKQGCLFSHLRAWEHIIQYNIAVAVVFEDDILFHPDFAQLAPEYYAQTSKDYDVLYLGSQLINEDKHDEAILREPVWCTHAMVVTLAGAKKLRDLVLGDPAGIFTLDWMIKNDQCSSEPKINWYVWNGGLHPTEQSKMANGWALRNSGLVFQDEQFPSFIKASY